jgi:hypothetical protein
MARVVDEVLDHGAGSHHSWVANSYLTTNLAFSSSIRIATANWRLAGTAILQIFGQGESREKILSIVRNHHNFLRFHF